MGADEDWLPGQERHVGETAHYSTAQLVEIHEALELIKDESKRWNVSLQSVIREASGKRSTQSLPAQKKTG
jgi:hypothetical protein